MKIIGLIGGIASGKSAVAAEFQRCGAGRLDADQTGHEVLELPVVRDALVARWGGTVLRPDGTVDRQEVAQIVFAPPPDGPKEREFLEKLTHPRIRALVEARITSLASQGTAVAVLDAALLLEAGWDVYCDEIVFVDAPTEVRMQRAAARGWSSDDFRRREAAQAGLAEKRARASVALDNGGGVEATIKRVRALYEQWSVEQGA